MEDRDRLIRRIKKLRLATGIPAGGLSHKTIPLIWAYFSDRRPF
ncbi:hypothetical protein Metfor_0746 [Methanoregula formicica SMSP]|uniref:Uncharacterized protein n=1 Tax=Methanoregula formicica (strain DSM 22288 / NBRC 105244 / SMSP) TaxID=593750 RepID=L0HDE4_METFS|nr:hypothetical protein Metfor_0746 [Methanoregula formicica SMSP]